MGKNYKKKSYKKFTRSSNSNKRNKKQKKSENNDIDIKRKKFKYIQRGKEAEEAQRRQKFVEDKYKRNTFNNLQIELEHDEEEDNPYETLLCAINQNKKDKNNENAIESSLSSSSDPSDEELDENNSLNLVTSKGLESDEKSEDINSVHDFSETDVSEVEDNFNDEENSNQFYSESKTNDEDVEVNEESSELVDESEYESESSDVEDFQKFENSKTDPFALHLDRELSQEHIDNLLQKVPKLKVYMDSWPILGKLKIELSNSSRSQIKKKSKNDSKRIKILSDKEEFASEGKKPSLIKHLTLDLCDHYVKNQLVSNIIESKPNDLTLSQLQCEIFSILNNYQDLYYPQRTFDNAEAIRYVYCLHALNHMLKTRSRIIRHNAKLSSEKVKKIIPDAYRDQGLIRPKVLIVLPFKSSVCKTMELLITLLFGKKSDVAKKDGSVRNYKRFLDEFTGDTIKFPKTKPKPEDYEQIFSGNTDDSFRLGISLTKKCMKLYQDFYSSDIIIASPLGLRMIVGAAGDAEREFDFLNSIEVLILDQTEIFFAQNWDHFIHVLDHLHLQPQSVQNTDFSRVRQWCLNGLSRFYRQTLLFSSHELPEFRALFNNKCFNYRGKVRVINPIEIGAIRNVATHVPQIFYKIDVISLQASFDIRFKYFTTEVLPQFKGPSMAHCMIYVPSYFDYVRLRNFMKSENINFVQICEYTEDGKIARARDMFFHSSAHFLLYSERAHFFKRTRIKGIRHLIMYQPPYWPNLYSEMINLMQEGYQNSRDGLETSMSITVLYTKYDILQVANIIGTERAAEILQSGKTSHMFTTSCD